MSVLHLDLDAIAEAVADRVIAKLARQPAAGAPQLLTRAENAEDEVRRLNALNELARYFTSGNSVPVEQATILANDFWRITGLTPNAAFSGSGATDNQNSDGLSPESAATHS
jgi:hypothetical protein